MDERELVQHGYRYALSLSQSPEDAEDLVQSACAKLIAKKGAIGPKALLFAAIRNLFYDGWRRGKILAFRSLTDEPPVERESPGASRDLDVLLGTLRPEEREAIYLNAVEGYTAEEISRLTGRPRNTVLSHLARARKRLEATAARETVS